MVRRPMAAERLRNARQDGTGPDNRELELAQAEHAFLSEQIAQLKHLLATAQIVDDGDLPTECVGIGSVVRVRDVEANEQDEFVLVGAWEANPAAGRVSTDCPIGQALYGLCVGEVAQVVAPEGILRYEVVAIERLP